jgi:hypothetical protein
LRKKERKEKDLTQSGDNDVEVRWEEKNEKGNTENDSID